ncbi:hypothetical protein ACLOJK_027365, partial [Asimina triloba]
EESRSSMVEAVKKEGEISMKGVTDPRRLREDDRCGCRGRNLLRRLPSRLIFLSPH